MKRVLIIVMALLFFVITAIAVSAAKLPEESANLSVNYTNEGPGITLPVTDKTTSGTLPDGTEFSAENLPENAVFLRIYPVQPEEKSVLNAVEDSLSEEADALTVYALSVLDGARKEVSNQGVKFTVKAPETEEDITVYTLSSDGKSTLLLSTQKNGKITFVTTGSQLYALTVPAENPGTSDFDITPFLLLAVFSAVFVIVPLLKHKRKT